MSDRAACSSLSAVSALRMTVRRDACNTRITSLAGVSADGRSLERAALTICLSLPSPFLPAMRPGSWARCPQVPAPTCTLLVVHLEHDSVVLFKEPFSTLSLFLSRRLSPSPPRRHSRRSSTRRSSINAAITSTAHGESAYTKIHEAKPT